jgi:hypothetical protein
MTIELTKKIGNKKVKFDLISLNGKATVKNSSLKELKKSGIREKEIEEFGFGVEPTN